MGTKDIKKIEGYDVEYIGDNAVASCVVFTKTGPLKNKYRLFNIPRKISGNDVGSLEHVLPEDSNIMTIPKLNQA